MYHANMVFYIMVNIKNYHVQHNKYVNHQDVKIYCAKKHFPVLQFLGPYNKPHVLCGLRTHYRMCFDPKLGRGTCAIRRIPFLFPL